MSIKRTALLAYQQRQEDQIQQEHENRKVAAEQARTLLKMELRNLGIDVEPVTNVISVDGVNFEYAYVANEYGKVKGELVVVIECACCKAKIKMGEIMSFADIGAALCGDRHEYLIHRSNCRSAKAPVQQYLFQNAS